MRSDTLHIVTAVANPIRWKSRIALARSAIIGWLAEPNVAVTLVECAYGGRPYELADLASAARDPCPGARHDARVEQGEPAQHRHLAPAGRRRVHRDVRRRHRVPQARLGHEAIAALDLYPVVQPWQNAYDLGPNDFHLQTHTSFASLWHAGKPVVALGPNFWKFQGGPYDYSHSGYAWAWQRRALDLIGGLFEDAGMGSGDHVMALALVGAADRSFPGEVAQAYRKAVMTWQAAR